MISQLDFIPLNTKRGFHLIRGIMIATKYETLYKVLLFICSLRQSVIDGIIDDVTEANLNNSEQINAVNTLLRGGYNTII